jgi:hypothetical protein
MRHGHGLSRTAVSSYTLIPVGSRTQASSLDIRLCQLYLQNTGLLSRPSILHIHLIMDYANYSVGDG